MSPISQNENILNFSDVSINNKNIHISCARKDATTISGNGIKTLKYEEGSVSIFTTGPSFSITIPELVADFHHTPKNSVLAFASDSCPAGWGPYKPAFGRFIRGIDNSGKKIDPAGKRKFGNPQEDTFKSHNHNEGSWNRISRYDGGNTVHAKTDNSSGELNIRNGGTLQARGGKETRPKNVALLYCIKM